MQAMFPPNSTTAHDLYIFTFFKVVLYLNIVFTYLLILSCGISSLSDHTHTHTHISTLSQLLIQLLIQSHNQGMVLFHTHHHTVIAICCTFNTFYSSLIAATSTFPAAHHTCIISVNVRCTMHEDNHLTIHTCMIYRCILSTCPVDLVRQIGCTSEDLQGQNL